MRLLPAVLHCGLLCLATIALPPSRTSADARSSPRRSDDKAMHPVDTGKSTPVTTPKPSTDPTSSSTSYSAGLPSSIDEGTGDSSASDLYFQEEEEHDKKSRMSPLRTALIVAVPVIAVAGFVTVTIVVAAVLIHKKMNKGFSLSYYKPSNELSILIDYGPHANFNPISYKYHDPQDLDTDAVVIHEYDVAANRYDHDRRGDAASKTSRYAHTRPATKTEADPSDGVHGTDHRTTVHGSGAKRARPHSGLNQLFPGVTGVVKDLLPSSAEPPDDSAGRPEGGERGGGKATPLPKPRLHGEQAKPTVTQRQSVLERWLIG